jgi:DNA ligase (NAD+)
MKEKIKKANEAYRAGSPIISDEEYDVLLSKLESEMSFFEFEEFKQTLMEKSGGYKHQYVMGSLSKVRYNEGDELSKWIKKHNVKEIIVSEKLDGCSFTAVYKDCKFVCGASRGDGVTGTDWTEKLKYILPKTINAKDDLIIRGELMLCGDAHVKIGYKNPRNGVVGIMGEDAIVPEKLKAVTAFVYDVLNTDYTPFRILKGLKENFTVPNFTKIKVTSTIEDDLKNLLDTWKNSSDYGMDGLVICTDDYINENVYHPEKKIAFKVNSEGIICEVIGVEWNTSKTGSIKPVVLIKPTEIDGTTVKRVSGYNYRFISNNCIGIGSLVSVIKSGDVIPKIINVIKQSTILEVPSVCPSCHGVVQYKEVDIVCNNLICGDQSVLKVNSFLRNCGVENASEKSLTNWGINTFDDLFNFKADSNYKSQVSFVKELDKVWKLTEDKLFSKMYFNGGGERTITKLIEFYGKGDVSTATKELYSCHVINYPEGIGYTTIVKLENDWFENALLLDTITHDTRYKPIVEKKETTILNLNITGLSFCITGTLSKPRKYFEDLVIKNGGKIGSVSKNLHYLIVGNDAGSKLDKATKLGIKILSGDEFEEMI